MLQSQVNYWNLQETKRHNQVMEDIERRRTEFQGLTANASVMQAETGRMLVPIEAEKAHASTTQAEAAKENVLVNWQNAYTNARNARTNEINASTNAYNAETNRINASTAIFNAETNRMMTESNMSLNASTEKLNESKISLNTSQEKVNSSVINLNKSTQDLNYAKGMNEAIDFEKGNIQLQYENANNILNLIGTGAGAYRDITSGTGSLLHGVDSIFEKNSKDTSDSGTPFNVKTLIDGIDTFISIGKFVS